MKKLGNFYSMYSHEVFLANDSQHPVCETVIIGFAAARAIVLARDLGLHKIEIDGCPIKHLRTGWYEAPAPANEVAPAKILSSAFSGGIISGKQELRFDATFECPNCKTVCAVHSVREL